MLCDAFVFKAAVGSVLHHVWGAVFPFIQTGSTCGIGMVSPLEKLKNFFWGFYIFICKNFILNISLYFFFYVVFFSILFYMKSYSYVPEGITAVSPSKACWKRLLRRRRAYLFDGGVEYSYSSVVWTQRRPLPPAPHCSSRWRRSGGGQAAARAGSRRSSGARRARSPPRARTWGRRSKCSSTAWPPGRRSRGRRCWPRRTGWTGRWWPGGRPMHANIYSIQFVVNYKVRNSNFNDKYGIYKLLEFIFRPLKFEFRTYFYFRTNLTT